MPAISKFYRRVSLLALAALWTHSQNVVLADGGDDSPPWFNPPHRATPLGRNGDWTPRKVQDEASMNPALEGRSEGESLPSCVKLEETIDVNDYFFDFFYVTIPKDSPLNCTANGGDKDSLFRIYIYSIGESGKFCEQVGQTVDCSLVGETEFLEILLEYVGAAGTRGTIELTCTNIPCSTDCGDGFCSIGFESIVSPGGDPATFCETDCGNTCGDGVCEPETGEDDTNCLRDCFLCEAVDKTVTLGPGETDEFQIEVLDGEYIDCYLNVVSEDVYPGDINFAMRFDEPACAYTEEQEFDFPTPAPTSSSAPSYAPPCWLENDCNGDFSCGSFTAVGTQTLYVTIYSPFDFIEGNIVCSRKPCAFVTEPPTRGPASSPTQLPSPEPTPVPTGTPSSAPNDVPTASPTSLPTGSPIVPVSEETSFFWPFSWLVDLLGQFLNFLFSLILG